MYAYFNAVLDANPSVVKLSVDDSCYATITGPVPDGEQDITSRVTVTQSVEADEFNRGYDASDTLVVLFRA